jgi:hypothetical protein
MLIKARIDLNKPLKNLKFGAYFLLTTYKVSISRSQSVKTIQKHKIWGWFFANIPSSQTPSRLLSDSTSTPLSLSGWPLAPQHARNKNLSENPIDHIKTLISSLVLNFWSPGTNIFFSHFK